MIRSRAEDDALAHSGRGSPACTTASDEAKARMKTKAEVEMAYMVQRMFFLMVYTPDEGSSPSFYTRLKPELCERTDASLNSLHMKP